MIKVNKPVTNPELVESMNDFINEKSAKNELKLIEKINKSHLMTPVIISDEVKNRLIPEETTVSFKTITNADNESYIVTFTDEDELSKWSKDKEQILAYTYDELNGIVLENINEVKGFVINPYGQIFIITPEVMQYFSKRKSEIGIKEDTKIMLGQPAVYPTELVNVMSKFFETQKEVKSAYLFLARTEGEQKSNLLFVIDFTCEKELLFPKIEARMQGHIGKGEYFDMISMDSSLGTSAVKNSTPFYKKQVRKLF
ncbi:enhanced serine sensitivity protein SseB [Clostridium estertheticum]|uniref:enhanced serine sensitivity protein SseB n=1 Tax=Clostridium estertheticum TaxID=238834 RepID=UPI001C7D93E3|nr:enhanced serine sensitivity protein SseB [Clostridium estertheticum]MBX4262664.1 enhanced serine sensitivity protein SseB [Clostridium estertheticum]WLC71465.1 enhanced serine sensitivity protein SseB [Clostridium estertheticum]